ncbi:MAG TPA: type II secretion system protein GspG [Verrucomicrobiae bacterium]|nr:type II secretion system protein GspG [Verrucomicrobiae bacterium]
MKDYTLKQSLMIVAGGCGLLLVGIYLFTRFTNSSTQGKITTTRNEEGQLANAIAQYAVVFQKYPASDNAALTKNLTGDNPQQLTLLTLAESSTNKDGQLVDIWSTPYKFAFVSTNSFTITSAGQNKTFGDTDDVVFNSISNALPPP